MFGFVCFCIGCRSHLRPSSLEEDQTVLRQSDGDVLLTRTKRALNGTEELYYQPNTQGWPLRVIAIDGKSVWWEFDRNQNGKVDEVRLGLRGGGWITVTDTNHDGTFDQVRGSANRLSDALPPDN